MNMPKKRGPKPKQFQRYYEWDQIPVMVDQGLICNLFGVSKPTLRKREAAGLITRIHSLANPPEGSGIKPLVRYKKEDVMRLADIVGEGAA